MIACELGGGSNPNFCRAKGNGINVDCRLVENVDIVADFEKPLPLSSGEFDLVFSQFAIEHISWRKVPVFINEIARILKPNGRAVIITADLRAQCLYILAKPVWTFAEVETIFGSQDYESNCHKSSMSQELARQLFLDAGFRVVDVTQVGICCTDMLINCQK